MGKHKRDKIMKFVVINFILLNSLALPASGLTQRCPFRNHNIKLGKVVPTQCKLIQGKWAKNWETCGAVCSGMPTCKVWTFDKGYCRFYKHGLTKCGLVRSAAPIIAGYRGCTN